jgi:hypothetical protein
MGTCTTTSTNPDKIAYQKRSDARKRAKLTKASGTQNACTKSHKHERQEGGLSTPTRCSKMTIRTTRQRLKPDTRAQAEGTGQENDTSALLVDAIRTTSRDPKARHRMEGRTSWESQKRTRHLINTKRKQANRSIFVGQHVNQLPALQHPVTRVITDDATQCWHHRQTLPRPGKPPSGEKHGTYTPGKPWDHPWKTRGRPP